MSGTTVTNIYEDVFKNIRKATEANLKMQQEVFNQWANMWPGVPSPKSDWVDKVREFQKEWSKTVTELARQHRDTLDRQYQAALDSMDNALRLAESGNPEEVRERTEQLFRKTLECMREATEAQITEFQDAMRKWGELLTKQDA